MLLLLKLLSHLSILQLLHVHSYVSLTKKYRKNAAKWQTRQHNMTRLPITLLREQSLSQNVLTLSANSPCSFLPTGVYTRTSTPSASRPSTKSYSPTIIARRYVDMIGVRSNFTTRCFSSPSRGSSDITGCNTPHFITTSNSRFESS